jgi:hypothetical protein
MSFGAHNPEKERGNSLELPSGSPAVNKEGAGKISLDSRAGLSQLMGAPQKEILPGTKIKLLNAALKTEAGNIIPAGEYEYAEMQGKHVFKGEKIYVLSADALDKLHNANISVDSGPPVPRSGLKPHIDEYLNLGNVKAGEIKLLAHLRSKHPNWDIVERNIYDLLTTRSEFIELKEEAGIIGDGDLSPLLRKRSAEQARYKMLKSQLQKQIETDNLKWENNPGWFGVNTRPEAPDRGGISNKYYVTIPTEQFEFIQHLPDLAQRLRKLSIETDDCIYVKIPENYLPFLKANDSLVTHFKKAENGNRIAAVVETWMKDHGITEESREMNRVKLSADSKQTSFSQLVASNIADWIRQHYGKYDHALLVKMGIQHAIEQSQVPPTIR